MNTLIPLRVQRIHDAAIGVKVFELTHADDQPLAPVEAGAHIELQLSNALLRSYSLFNAPGETHRYQIAVHHTPDSAGGSRHMHQSVKVGDVISVSAPRNHFPLNEAAPHTCLIAGGIGITPLLAMAQRLTAIGNSWELHYCARTPKHAALVEEVRALADANVNACHFYFDQMPGGKMLDIGALVHSLPEHTHFYSCGPRGMLESFEAATAHCAERRHVEYFAAKAEADVSGGFQVELARSGKTLNVPAGKSILDVVLDAGISVNTSCREGICGSCETRIISGQAEHRDALLSPEEQAANQTMMICCSGSRSSKLVLDL
jgi:vanillate O-demethylase ferredoxin subunit